MPNPADTKFSESSNSSAGVSAVAIKTPAFQSCGSLSLNLFAFGNISVDSTKFHYVIAALNSDDLTCVSDLVLNPPQIDSYNSLKTKLIAQNADSESVRLKKLLSRMELGDKKSSTLLYEMKSLASEGISPELLKGLWMQRLPVQIQQILSVSSDNLQALSKMADSICEILKDDLVASMSTNFQSSDDRLTKSLVPPYSGPHLVVSKTSKHFTIQVESRQQTISIDRLKPAFHLAKIQPFRESFSILSSYRLRRGALWRCGPRL
ncbi:hypothetical protein AVEN_91543-1 [Araneus ventricosus]|uniref:DUF7041 domain-containing protein n=1 Tax=Araneus ventricosus TaxID=182803 RepID=A0A4Y2BJS3_ARAVE|nr:hypothetical protein AVEN_91543-1 [Araneus ventricosus]